MRILQSLKGIAARSKTVTSEFLTALETVRRQIGEANEERVRIELQPPERDVIIHRLDQWLSSLAGHRGDETYGFLAVDFQAPTVRDAGQYALGFLVPTIREDLVKQIDAKLARTPGISDAGRKAELAKVDATVLELGLIEESIIRSAEVKGIDLARRTDADPCAVLAADSALPS